MSALELLNKAIDLEPSYAPALAHAAWCIEQRLTRDWPRIGEDDVGTSVVLARRAVAAGSDDAVAVVLAGFVLVMVGRDYTAGLDDVRRAVERNPGSGFVNFFAGTALVYGGEPEKALPLLRRAMMLGPLDPSYYMYLMVAGWAELFSGHPDEALALAERSVALYPEWDSTYWVLIPAYVQLDRARGARRAREIPIACAEHGGFGAPASAALQISRLVGDDPRRSAGRRSARIERSREARTSLHRRRNRANGPRRRGRA